MDFIDKIKFDEKGLIPAVIQDINTKEVLMVGYMNKVSLEKTIETKMTWFYSRSRKKLWNKGETSGNTQKVEAMYYDCDADTLLLKVKQKGKACHTGSYSCFYNKFFQENELIEKSRKEIIKDLYVLIENRKENPVKQSYTNYLFEKGLDKILKKVGEESSEVIIGAKNRNREEVIYEISDLVYHILVLMVEMGVTIEDIQNELYNRNH